MIPPLATLALCNLTADRRRFVVTIVALSLCVFLVIFQGSLLIGFVAASSRVIRGLDADVLVVPRGVPCIEFAAPLPDRTAQLMRGIPGVRGVVRGVAGFTNWKTARGAQQVVLLLGIERWPDNTIAAVPSLAYDEVAVDESNLGMLELDRAPADVEINGHRARFFAPVSGFGSFMGSPYVFAPFGDARTWLGLPEELTNFIAIRTSDNADPAAVVERLRQRFPHVDVHLAASFASIAETFWLIRTGAGGGLLIAALLGIIVGATILSQTLYAITLEHRAEFVTLRALGAGNGEIRRVVMWQALVCGGIGWLAGSVAAYPLTELARHMVAWIMPVWWLPLIALGATIVVCVVASVTAVRAVLRMHPADIFSGA
jgi:putative ABC transport system permease protein